MALVTKAVRDDAQTEEMLVELQANLMDAQDLARAIARRISRRPPDPPATLARLPKAA